VHRVAIYSSTLICKVFCRRMLVSCLVILEMRFISLRNKHRCLRLNELIKFPLARFVSILKKCFKFMNTCTIVHFLNLYFKNKHDCEKFTDLCTEFIHYTIPFDSIVALMPIIVYLNSLGHWNFWVYIRINSSNVSCHQKQWHSLSQ